MSAGKIGSPFESVWGDHTISWNGEFVMVGYAQQTYATQVIKAAIEAWTPKPPEGWEEYPEGENPDKPEGYWCEKTGTVWEWADTSYRTKECAYTFGDTFLAFIGFVPVRRVKPSVPKWAKNLENGLRGIDEDYWGDYLAKYCVPKADADEMLPRLRRLHAYLSPGDIRDDVAALIERMEGKS